MLPVSGMENGGKLLTFFPFSCYGFPKQSSVFKNFGEMAFLNIVVKGQDAGNQCFLL